MEEREEGGGEILQENDLFVVLVTLSRYSPHGYLLVNQNRSLKICFHVSMSVFSPFSPFFQPAMSGKGLLLALLSLTVILS